MSPAPANTNAANTFEDRKLELLLILECARQAFAEGEEAPAEIVGALVLRLHEFRAACGRATWSQLVPLAQAHPVRDHLHQDPFTKRSFDKPRGYSGDGVLLDLLYRHADAQNRVVACSALGQEIYAHTSTSSSAAAVQERRALLARLADATAERTEGAEILAVAGGHLREAELSTALAEGRIARWMSFDQDAANLSKVAEAHGSGPVQPFEGSVKALVGGADQLGRFDLIYSAGVYDYLDDATSVLLTQRLLGMLKPGGEVVFGNFSTEVVPDGYMETFMDWQLLMRDEEKMWQITCMAAEPFGAEAEVFFGENRHIVYARLRLVD